MSVKNGFSRIIKKKIFKTDKICGKNWNRKKVISYELFFWQGYIIFERQNSYFISILLFIRVFNIFREDS